MSQKTCQPAETQNWST